ncbi:MAG: CoA transferase [Ilumatobacteraceae bacterium]
MAPTDSTTARPALPLVGVRVLECGDTVGAAYAGRLLADLGADVVKVEPPSGDILRHLGPTVGGVADPEASAGFGYFHAGKRSIVVDGDDPSRQAVLRALAAASDIVIRCTRSGDDWLSDEELAAAEVLNRGLIVVDISTWGRAAADRSNSDLIALAAGGLLSVNGTDAVAAKSVPLRYRGEFSSVHAACDAVLAALGALHARLADGRGQRLDISAQAATASILATAMSTYLYTGVMPVRDGVRGVAPWGFYTCRDGVVLLQVTEDPQWFNLRRIIGEPEWAQPDVFDTTAMRAELHDVIDPLLEAELRAFSVDAFLAACQREGVAAARIQDAKDLLAWPHLRARNYFTPVEFAARPGTEVIAPTPPWRFAITPSPEAPRVSPALGADEACLVAEWQPRPSDRAFRDPAHGDAAHGDAAHGDPAVGPRPLAGLRVIDMTWVWAGPFCATQLAHLGADVIKFESTSRIDVTRRLGPFAGDEIGINRSGYFNQYNQGKRSVVLDVKDPRGLAALKRVIATADLIIDNMRPGALARMGLPMEELRKLNPKIVAVAMSGFGESGPERDRMAYGSIIDALSGVAASNGMPGGGPTDFPMSLPDPAAGIHAAIASVAALYRARRTGIGDRVEVAMLEATLAAFPWPMLIEAAGAGPVAHEGNRDATMSPHGTFPCVDDDWLALAVRDDTEFAALAGVLDQPALIVDPRFAAIADRKVNEDELERLVSAWTRTCGRDDAVARLRHAGVTAERVLTMAEVAVSPALTARDFMQRCPHPEVGERPLPGPAWVASRSPMRTTTAAPCFGQHTREVMHEVLGLTEDEIQAMDDDGLLR